MLLKIVHIITLNYQYATKFTLGTNYTGCYKCPIIQMKGSKNGCIVKCFQHTVML